MDFSQIIQNFQVAMLTHGITPPDHIIADGQLHRFYVQKNKRGSKNGWYIFFTDGVPSGVFGSWKTGLTSTWCAKKHANMSRYEFAEHARQVADAQRHRNAQREKEQAEAAKMAEYIFRSSPIANPHHSYLVRKQSKPFCAHQKGSYLILPVINFSGNFRGLQYIAPNGSKWFLTNSVISGHFIPVQHQPIEGIKILLCEGFATGSTLAQAYPYACVMAACNAGNLKSVAVSIRQHLPKAEIIVCADDDRLNPDNPGINKGREAAIASNAFFTKPKWPEDAPQNLSDFCDLALWLSGMEIAA